MLIAFIGNLSAYAQTDTLHVYSPGGPLSAMQDCAKAFTAKTGTPVTVIGGPEPKWLALAQQNADVIYGGAEYMLTQFIQAHPGMVDAGTRVELYKEGQPFWSGRKPLTYCNAEKPDQAADTYFRCVRRRAIWIMGRYCRKRGSY